MVFQYFAHFNAVCAVKHNNAEGKKIVEACGLEWTGTTYYNSRYYYKAKQVQRLLQKCAMELVEKQSAENCLKQEELEADVRFAGEGGITFHSAWQHFQRKNNHPENSYGLRHAGAEPPHGFIYLYRNCYEKEQEEKIIKLLEQMQECGRKEGTQPHRLEGIGVKEKYYNNGRSYLLNFEAGVQWGGVAKPTYQKSMAFLQNFRLFRVSGCMECLYMAEGE
jgi:hypothetical protein